MFYIETKDNTIFCKGVCEFLGESQIGVDESFYNQLQIPSTFELVDGEMVNIMPIPQQIPEPIPSPEEQIDLLTKELAEQKALINAMLG